MINFTKIETKEVAYFLGFMWSDGYIRKYRSVNQHYKISLEINSEDALSINSIMSCITDWAIFKRKRKENWKETWTFSKNSQFFYDFLEENDYVNKSITEPTKILKLIPEDLVNYFWKGVIDGDGSLGFSGRGSYFEVASTYDYEYKELNTWLNKMGIEGKIYKQISKKGHKSSVYKIYGKKIIKLKEYFPEFGLLRKNEKLKQIIQKYEK